MPIARLPTVEIQDMLRRKPDYVGDNGTAASLCPTGHGLLQALWMGCGGFADILTFKPFKNTFMHFWRGNR